MVCVGWLFADNATRQCTHACNACFRACRVSMGEAVIKAAAPGANITAILITMDAKYRMVLTAFNNTDLYRKLYWAGIGYTPGPRAAASKGRSGDDTLSMQQTAGASPACNLRARGLQS
jgi:hypothetical protein